MAKIKKLFASTTAFLLAVSLLASCSSAPAESETPASTPESQAEQTDDGSGLSGDIIYLNHSGEDMQNQWQDMMAEEFMTANPDVNLEIQRMSFDSYVTTLQAKFASGDAPDLFENEGTEMFAFYENGYTEPLTGQAFLDNFRPDDLAPNTVDGEIIAIPATTGSMFITYNKDVFEANGVAVPTTLDEFYAACDTFEAAGISAIAAGFKETWTITGDTCTDYAVGVLAQDDMGILNLLDRTTTFADSELWAASFQRFLDRGAYLTDDPFGTDWSMATSMVATGEAAMVLNGDWTIGAVREKNPDVNIGVFAIPTTNNADETVMLVRPSIGGMSLSASSENKDAALAFMAQITTPEAGSSFAQMTNKLSVIIGAEPPEDPAWQEFNSYLENEMYFNSGVIDLNFPNEYRVAFETLVSEHLLAGTTDVNLLLADLDTEFDRIAESLE